MSQQHDAAGKPSTIWRPVTEDRFIKLVNRVQAISHQVPEGTHVFELNHQLKQTNSGDFRLPSDLEYQLVQDLAFIVAHEHGVHTVSAVTIEEKPANKKIFCNVATNSGAREFLRQKMYEVGKLLEQCARKELGPSECTEQVFEVVLRLCEKKIMSRVRSKDWKPPAHFKKKRPGPIYIGLENFIKNRHKQSRKFSEEVTQIINRLQLFVNFVKKADCSTVGNTHETRLEALRLAGRVCGRHSSVEASFRKANLKLTTTELESLRAFDKLANYRHVSERLTHFAVSKSFRHLFHSIEFKWLESYVARCLKGHEKRYVHAEIQQATYHRVRKTKPFPRTIGTSKAACYLCSLFLSHHTQYNVSATHGVIYNAWTIPDVLAYSKKDRCEIKAIIKSMTLTLEAKISEGQQPSRSFPVQSGIFHNPSFVSLEGTVINVTPTRKPDHQVPKLFYTEQSRLPGPDCSHDKRLLSKAILDTNTLQSSKILPSSGHSLTNISLVDQSNMAGDDCFCGKATSPRCMETTDPIEPEIPIEPCTEDTTVAEMIKPAANLNHNEIGRGSLEELKVVHDIDAKHLSSNVLFYDNMKNSCENDMDSSGFERRKMEKVKTGENMESGVGGENEKTAVATVAVTEEEEEEEEEEEGEDGEEGEEEEEEEEEDELKIDEVQEPHHDREIITREESMVKVESPFCLQKGEAELNNSNNDTSSTRTNDTSSQGSVDLRRFTTEATSILRPKSMDSEADYISKSQNAKPNICDDAALHGSVSKQKVEKPKIRVDEPRRTAPKRSRKLSSPRDRSRSRRGKVFGTVRVRSSGSGYHKATRRRKRRRSTIEANGAAKSKRHRNGVFEEQYSLSKAVSEVVHAFKNFFLCSLCR